MKCFDPKLCYTNTEGKKILRHFSQSTQLFKKMAQQVFDCGTCLFCRKKNSFSLAMRCCLHASLYKKNCFLTLTHDESKPEYHNNFDYTEIQKFKKILRTHVNTTEYCHIKTRKLKRRRVPKWLYKKIEVFNVHEYGKNGKKHWHLIVFNYDFPDKEIHTIKNQIPLYTSAQLEKLWPYGFNTIGDVSEASAMYQAQYTQKDIKNNNTSNERKSKSKHSGIGKPYFLKHYKQILSLGYVPFGNKKIPLPRYFEKLADKHWSHFNDQSKFYDLHDRKRIYTPFKPGQANLEISELYSQYKQIKDERVQELTEEWNLVISQYIETKDQPDFIKSAQNALYDLNNRMTQERF